MRAQSGERADRRALEQPCAGHKVELQDKVEPGQAGVSKTSCRLDFKCPGKLKLCETQFRSSRSSDVQIEKATANMAPCHNFFGSLHSAGRRASPRQKCTAHLCHARVRNSCLDNFVLKPKREQHGGPFCVDRYTSHVFFLMICTCVHTHCMAQDEPRLNVSAGRIHPRCVFECCWSSFCPSPVSLHLLVLLFHTLPVLCPALHLQCRQRRGVKPLHSRRKRSTAP